MTEVTCSTEIQVPFYDVDALHIVWHGHYVKYMEQARCELLDLLDYNYQQMQASGYTWPVIELHLKYIKPLKFKQIIRVESKITESEYGLKVDFEFWDKLSNEKLSKGYTKQVAVDNQSGEMSLLSPSILQQKIDAYCGA